MKLNLVPLLQPNGQCVITLVHVDPYTFNRVFYFLVNKGMLLTFLSSYVTSLFQSILNQTLSVHAKVICTVLDLDIDCMISSLNGLVPFLSFYLQCNNFLSIFWINLDFWILYYLFVCQSTLTRILSCSCWRFFEECQHPTERHRHQLGKELGLTPTQIKFWFQNKRTLVKVLFLFGFHIPLWGRC